MKNDGADVVLSRPTAESRGWFCVQVGMYHTLVDSSEKVNYARFILPFVVNTGRVFLPSPQKNR